MVELIAILTDTQGNKVGAILNDNGVMREIDISNVSDISRYSNISNAEIDSNGNIRVTKGSVTKMIKPSFMPLPPKKISAVQNAEMLKIKSLISCGMIEVYHGSKNPSLIPKYGFPNDNNDYGRGLYTTPYKELAKEWPYSEYTKGDTCYVYTYSLDLRGLNILNIAELDSMYWLAELVSNRDINKMGYGISDAFKDNMVRLKRAYKLDTSNYDIIIGYRADDKFFAFAKSFISGASYRETFEKALRLGNLGIQVFIKSEKAFSRLKQSCDVEKVPPEYRYKYAKRDKNAREAYDRLAKENHTAREKITIYDALKGVD